MSWSAKTFWNNHSWPSSESIGNRGESYQRDQAQRKILQRSSMRAPCDFFEMFWPSLISWSALTLSGVRCNLLKQSRLTFFKSKSEIHHGIGRSSRSPVWKHRVSFSRFTLDRHRGQHSAYQLLSSTLTFNDVLIGIDLVRGKMWPSETITFWLSSKSIENRTESGGTCQRNQAFRLTTACGFFEMPWPTQMSIKTHRVIHSIDVIWCLIGTDFVRGKMCLSNLQLIHSHHFSSTPCWAFPPAQHVEKTCFAIAASYLWNVVLTLGRMPVTTRQIGTISPLTWDFIPFVKRFAILFVRWFSFSVWGCLRFWCRRGRPLFLFKKFAPVTRSSNSMMETARVSFRTLSSCLPLPAISHFPFNVGSIVLSTPCHYSSMNHIFLGFKVPTSHLLVKAQSQWCFKSWITCLFFVSHRFWIIQSQHSP